MSLYSFYRISKPSSGKVPSGEVQSEYKSLRNRTFWGATVAYSLYYVCRMSLSVVKQPIIDDGVLTPGQLGIIGSALLFIYAVGKFMNGFIADYCNIRRFMATGLTVSALINLLMGASGLLYGTAGIASGLLFAVFAVVWGINGWVQSMGAPPGVINLSRWFPMSKRGTYYGIFSSSPYIGEFLSFIIVGVVVSAFGWEYGFIFSAIGGLVGAVIILVFVSDTPESKGLPSVQELSGEKPVKTDSLPTVQLQKMVLTHPGIWIIAVSSAFIYITKYAVAGWGVLFLQKAKMFSLESATQIIAFSAAFGVLGTVMAGWLSDTVFKGDRIKPAVISVSRALPADGRGIYHQYLICVSFQPFHRCTLLYNSRAYGCGHSSPESYGCRSWYSRHIKLCGGWYSGHSERLSYRGVCREARDGIFNDRCGDSCRYCL